MWWWSGAGPGGDARARPGAPSRARDHAPALAQLHHHAAGAEPAHRRRRAPAAAAALVAPGPVGDGPGHADDLPREQAAPRPGAPAAPGPGASAVGAGLRRRTPLLAELRPLGRAPVRGARRGPVRRH